MGGTCLLSQGWCEPRTAQSVLIVNVQHTYCLTTHLKNENAKQIQEAPRLHRCSSMTFHLTLSLLQAVKNIDLLSSIKQKRAGSRL